MHLQSKCVRAFSRYQQHDMMSEKPIHNINPQKSIFNHLKTASISLFDLAKGWDVYPHDSCMSTGSLTFFYFFFISRQNRACPRQDSDAIYAPHDFWPWILPNYFFPFDDNKSLLATQSPKKGDKTAIFPLYSGEIHYVPACHSRGFVKRL